MDQIKGNFEAKMKFIINTIIFIAILLALPLICVIGMFSMIFDPKETKPNNIKNNNEKESRKINPATGLPMLGNCGVDIHGNPFGCSEDER